MIRVLLHKSWLETRTRFLAACVILFLLGVTTVLRAPATIHSHELFRGVRLSYSMYVWLSLWHGYLQFLWIIAAVILGLGGLLREESCGTAAFTLSLPISRWQILLTRAIVGTAEAVVLAFIPGAVVSSLSQMMGFHYPFTDVLLYGAALVGAGLVFHALGFLLSQILRGESLPPVVGLSLIAAFYIATRFPRFQALDVFALMSGKPIIKPETSWMPVVACLFVFAAMIAVATSVATKRNY